MKETDETTDSRIARGILVHPAREVGLAVYKLYVNDHYDAPPTEVPFKHDEQGLWVGYTQDFVGSDRSFSVTIRYFVFDDGEPDELFHIIGICRMFKSHWQTKSPPMA